MPLYDYVCDNCGNQTEAMRSMDHRHDALYCAKCEGPMLLQFVAPRALRTDTAFQRGIHSNDGLRNDKERRRAKALANRMGVNIEGKRYDGRFARFALDPMAFYGDRSEARAACARAGRGSEDLGVKAPADDTTGRPYRVADDVVARHAKERVIDNHGGTVTRDQWNRINEEVREQITPADAPTL